MADDPNTPDLLDRFFTEDARTLLTRPEPPRPETAAVQEPLSPPQLPEAATSPPDEIREYWRLLRLFHHSGKGGGLATATPEERPVPLVFDPFRSEDTRADLYPCWVGEGLEATCLPVDELLRQTLRQFAPAAADAPVLHRFMDRLTAIFRQRAGQVDGPVPLATLWPEVLDAFATELSLNEADRAQVDHLGQHLPRTGQVVPFSEAGLVDILGLLLEDRAVRRRLSWENVAAPLRAGIAGLLDVERSKGAEAHSPDRLKTSMDLAGDFLNFDELAELLPDDTANRIPEDRLHRLEEIHYWLTEGPDRLFRQSGVLVHADEDEGDVAKDLMAASPGLKPVESTKGGVLNQAREEFTNLADLAVRMVSAARIAALELSDRYDPDVHDHYFVHFQWSAFDEDERGWIPPVLALTDRRSLLGREAIPFGNILARGLPVRVLCLSDPYPEAAEDWAYRPEPGSLAMAYRDAFVYQTAGVDPANLYTGYIEGLSAPQTTLFHLLDPGRPADVLGHHAALVSREYPAFLVDGGSHARWGSRFNLADNPAYADNWVVLDCPVRLPDGEGSSLSLSVTPADYGALFPGLHRHFLPVPESRVTGDLVAMSDYLTLDADSQVSRIPYIWLVMPDRRLVRAAVTRTLTKACQERLEFWHYLQEQAGIRNVHAEHAREELTADFARERDQERVARDQSEAEAVRTAAEDATRLAMDRLARALLDMDLAGIQAPSFVARKASTVAPTPEDTPAVEEVAEAKPAPAVTLVQEAWIDSAQCTSCNECINLNKRMFHYNDQKQAVITDIQAGTFAELVQAAERCPVGIIHPGAPVNKDEPGLDALVERAKAFN